MVVDLHIDGVCTFLWFPAVVVVVSGRRRRRRRLIRWLQLMHIAWSIRQSVSVQPAPYARQFMPCSSALS